MLVVIVVTIRVMIIMIMIIVIASVIIVIMIIVIMIIVVGRPGDRRGPGAGMAAGLRGSLAPRRLTGLVSIIVITSIMIRCFYDCYLLLVLFVLLLLLLLSLVVVLVLVLVLVFVWGVRAWHIGGSF